MYSRKLTPSSSKHIAKYIRKRNNQMSPLLIYLMRPFMYFLLLGTYLGWSRAATVGDFLPYGAQLTLPQGFRPQHAPNKPMLLPFVTPAPSSPSGGWKPIVGAMVKPTHSTRKPTTTPTRWKLPLLQQTKLEDCIYTTKRQDFAELEEGPVLESVVYGTWKPGRPLRPEEMQASTTRKPHSDVLKTTVKKSARPTSKNRTTNSATQAIDSRFMRKTESRRFPTTTRSVLKFKNSNSTDPKLNSTLSQLSKNTHLNSYATEPSLPSHESSTESAAITESEPSTLDVQKIWPTDFVPTFEQDKEKGNQSAKTLNHSFENETPFPSYHLNSKLNATTIAATLLPRIPLNITKVGVPYETADSDEEPKICVPIAVIEELSQMELERVYCFPLPPPHAKETSNATVRPPKVVNYTEYGAVNVAERLSISYIKQYNLTLMILYIFWDKYS